MFKFFITFGVAMVLASCSSTPEEPTLASLDVASSGKRQQGGLMPHRSEQEVKEAYYHYLQEAEAGDRARLIALNRLADMEIESALSTLKQTSAEVEVDERYRASLRRTLALLETSLRDYPNEPTNDKVLYRLARVQDQLGNRQASNDALARLADQFPTSDHYAEAQFRLAEQAFLGGDYISAEDAYTEVIYSLHNQDFLSRAFFKRGWARYKQGLYQSAAEDHLEAIRQQNFADYASLKDNQRRVFDEYFRALALDAAHMPRFQSVQSLFAKDEIHYLYHTCRSLSTVYLLQERYSDAAEVLGRFVEAHPSSPHAARAAFKAVDIWKQGGFRNRYLAEIESFYADYNPSGTYWADLKLDGAQALPKLREHVLQVASHYHRQSLDDSDGTTAASAAIWYQRYLKDFSSYARQDKVHLLYGDLLQSTGRLAEAVAHYERAAFDSKIIIDKVAARSAISLLAELLSKQENTRSAWLEKYLLYAKRYAQLYSDDAEVVDLVLHASETALKARRFDSAIDISNLMPASAAADAQVSVRLVKARALTQTGRLLPAEEMLTALLREPLSDTKRETVEDNLALVVYQQGSAAKKAGKLDQAIERYAHVAAIVPHSPIAPQALYDGIVLAMDHQRWQTAIGHLETFERLYPRHEKKKDVVKRLSEAYMQAERYAQAAKALEKISADADDTEVQMVALWRAAELYAQEGEFKAAIRTYRTYAHTYKRPYPQFMEAMHRLRLLYDQQQDNYRRNFWEQRIFEAERNAPDDLKTERTRFIAAKARLAQARRAGKAFAAIKLMEPLAENLRRKKAKMEKAIALYSDASSYNLADVATESTYAIAAIYGDFARELLASERPAGLSASELAQYEILIEDQAFPFEDMAVEFHEINLSRISQGTVNQWIIASLRELRKLFPVRYNRKGRIAAYRPQ